ncbi:response regulator transcription factor [Fulvivirga sediminis]|uniref:Response regulator transcription factor n=1 Tax=Fulvivirga sediminis TaxID=2803949 RepID=A0A937F839_9BACT|nr:response regulator transcription factor [Fulvivirga sediminis]MBL3655798.1 response regulator transcription factor [Fulvivirga sediminis]
MKVLVVEDEPDMLESITESLRQEEYTVENASDMSSALVKIGAYDYDCILLDITLPDGNGLNLLEHLKKEGKGEGVIIVSAKNAIEDKIHGLDLGADDYLPKPFHMAELHARVKSVLRRRRFEGNKALNFKGLCIHPEEHTVDYNGEQIELNRKEFDILLYLAMNDKRLVSKMAIAEHVWGDHMDEADDYEFVYSQIKNLRKKLKLHHAPVAIKAIYGVGYKLDVL